MKWVLPLQAGSLAGKNKEKIIRGIRTGRFFLNTFVVMLPTTFDNQLEIIQASELKQPYYKKNEPTIIGIAIGKNEAIALVSKLIEKSVATCGSADVREYIKTGIADGSLRLGADGEARDIARDTEATAASDEASEAEAKAGDADA